MIKKMSSKKTNKWNRKANYANRMTIFCSKNNLDTFYWWFAEMQDYFDTKLWFRGVD